MDSGFLPCVDASHNMLYHSIVTRERHASRFARICSRASFLHNCIRDTRDTRESARGRMRENTHDGHIRASLRDTVMTHNASQHSRMYPRKESAMRRAFGRMRTHWRLHIMRNTHDGNDGNGNENMTDNTREKIARNLSGTFLATLNANHFYNRPRNVDVTENHAFNGIVNGDAVMLCGRGHATDANVEYLILRFCGIVVRFNNGNMTYNARLCPVTSTTDDDVKEYDATTFDVFPRRADNIDAKRAIYRANAKMKRDAENAGKEKKIRVSRNNRAIVATDADTMIHRVVSVSNSDVNDARARLSQIRNKTRA